MTRAHLRPQRETRQLEGVRTVHQGQTAVGCQECGAYDQKGGDRHLCNAVKRPMEEGALACAAAVDCEVAIQPLRAPKRCVHYTNQAGHVHTASPMLDGHSKLQEAFLPLDVVLIDMIADLEGLAETFQV